MKLNEIAGSNNLDVETKRELEQELSAISSELATDGYIPHELGDTEIEDEMVEKYYQRKQELKQKYGDQDDRLQQEILQAAQEILSAA